MTIDYLGKGKTNRPADATLFDIYRRQFGDAELKNLGTFFNSALPVGDAGSFYAFGGLNYRHTDAYAWTRDPGSSSRKSSSIVPQTLKRWPPSYCQ